MGERMNVQMANSGDEMTQAHQLNAMMAPPHAPLAMPKQVLMPAHGGFMRMLRGWLAIAPGLRRLG